MNVEVIRAASRIRPLKSMAIMKSVRYGLNAFGEVGLHLAVYISEDVGAPMTLFPRQADLVIRAYDVGSVANLEGKPCWVVIRDGIISFDSPCLICGRDGHRERTTEGTVPLRGRKVARC